MMIGPPFEFNETIIQVYSYLLSKCILTNTLHCSMQIRFSVSLRDEKIWNISLSNGDEYSCRS